MIIKNAPFHGMELTALLQFGKGDIVVCSALAADSSFAVVALKSDKPAPIGALAGVTVGTPLTEFNPEIVMTFTSRGSIDVLIENLLIARKTLPDAQL